MIRATPWLPRSLVAALAAAVLLTPASRAADVGYAEDFALARDRAAALARLIPGTEDYYYYHCLHRLNTGQLDQLDQYTRPWVERFALLVLSDERGAVIREAAPPQQ